VTHRSAAHSLTQRSVSLLVGVVLALAGALVALPAQADGTRTISGTFTIPTAGIEAGWQDTVSAQLYSSDGEYYKSVTLNTTAKTFSVTGVDNGTYRLKFTATQLCGYTGCWSANLLGGWYGGGDGTLIDVTTANRTGLTYAFAAGRTISGTISLGAGTDPAWKDYVYATVTLPGPEGCNCGDSITALADASGHYIVRGLEPGAYTLSFRASDNGSPTSPVNLIAEYYNNSYSWAGRTQVDVRTGNKTGINATLELGRTISGTVTIPAGADPEEAKHIYVSAAGDNGFVTEAQVDPATGAYTLYGLAPTSYTVKASGSNWWNSDYSMIVRSALANTYYGGAYTANDAAHVDVTSANATGKNITLGLGRTISGTVSLAAGVDPLWKNYLLVSAEDGENYRSAAVDPVTGAYTIVGLAPLPQTVSFSATGYSDGPDWVDSPFAFEYYNNERNPLTANPVNVTAGNVSAINATMDVQVGNKDFWATPVPVVTGSAVAGGLLTVNSGEWAPSANLSYQWKRNGTDISGATQRSYTVTQADAGATLSVAVTGSGQGFNAVTVTSAGTAVALTPFTTTPVPTITGTARVGSTVTAVPGAWAPAASFTYQWKRNGVNIAGATAATYLVQQADATTNLTVSVTGSAAGYIATTRNSGALPIPASAFVSAPAPGITGTVAVGNTLTGLVGTWSPSATFTYAWLRNGSPIAGATDSTYTLVEADGGQYITFRVTGAAAGYETTTRISGAVTAPGHAFVSMPAPDVEGTVKVGQTLTAVLPTWDPAADFGIEWLRDGEPTGLANVTTYKLTGADYGHKVSVRITAHLDGYERAQAESIRKSVVSGTFVPATPTISGSSYRGATLTAKVGTWVPAASAYSYQWYRSGKAISGATKSTYKLTASDSGKKITVKVTGKATGYTTASKTSASKSLAKFFTTNGAVKITGTVKVGSTVKASVGTWSPKPSSYSYQWYANGVAISGATKSSYKVPASTVGKKLTVKVTAKRSGYASTPKTSGAKTVAHGTFTTAPTPKITGTAKVGSTLKVTKGTWKPTPSSYSYQWYRSGKAISGATTSSYKLTASDKGKTITVKVTAKKTGYTSKSKTSGGKKVAPGTFTTAPTPKITGTLKVGSTLKVTKGTWKPTPSSYSYQWYRSGKAISGATTSSYKLTASDKGKTITVKVTAKKTGYTSKSKTSAKTSAVK